MDVLILSNEKALCLQNPSYFISPNSQLSPCSMKCRAADHRGMQAAKSFHIGMGDYYRYADLQGAIRTEQLRWSMMNTALGWSLCLLLLAMKSPATLAQSSSAELSPSARQRVEALLRSKAEFPPASSLSFRLLGPSELPGFDKLSAHFASAMTGASGDVSLLISEDRTRLAQFTTYDIAADPRAKVPSEGRPSRGGPATAPVVIVSFDDLECPYCARLHKELFPALTDHYKDQVKIVYQSLPSEGHPWAMRAAVDTDCLGKESPAAYWAAVDKIHERASEYGGTERKLAVAEHELDIEATEEGHRFHVDEEKLKACIAKQDKAPVQQSMALASSLGVSTTPTVFVNGARFEGAVPIEFVFEMVDNALRAEDKVPPPREGKADHTRSGTSMK